MYMCWMKKKGEGGRKERDYGLRPECSFLVVVVVFNMK